MELDRDKLFAWIDRFLVSKECGNEADIHISDLYRIADEKLLWCSQGVLALEEVERYVFMKKGNVNMGLCFSLKYAIDQDISNWDAVRLSKVFDDSPPAIYLFRPSAAPWSTYSSIFRSIGIPLGLQQVGHCRECWMCEWLPEPGSEPFRSMWLVKSHGRLRDNTY